MRSYNISETQIKTNFKYIIRPFFLLYLVYQPPLTSSHHHPYTLYLVAYIKNALVQWLPPSASNKIA